MHYDGTLILISHDRYFLDKIVGRVVELKDTHLTQYAGNYSYYLQKRDEEPEFVVHTKTEEKPKEISPLKKTKEQKRQEAEARQVISRERNRLKKIVTALEQQIEEQEKQKEHLEFEMARQETYQESTHVIILQKEYAVLQKDLEHAYRRWEEAQLELEELVSQVT